MKKQKMRYLVRYSEKDGEYVFFISPFGYNQFIKNFKGRYENILVGSFYGSSLDVNYNQEDSTSVKTLQQLESFLNEKENLVLNDLKIEIIETGNHYTFNDNFECTLFSKNVIMFNVDLTFIINDLNLYEFNREELFSSDDCYLTVDINGRVDGKFDSFEDYLKSI